MRHLICIVFALVLLQTVSIAKDDVIIKTSHLKDIPGCVLGNPVKYKEGGTFVRVCINNKRYEIRNVSSPYGYEELEISQVYQYKKYGRCSCPKEEIRDLQIGERVNIVIYKPDSDEMRYVNDTYYVNNARVTSSRVSYTNAKGEVLTYVNKRPRKK